MAQWLVVEKRGFCSGAYKCWRLEVFACKNIDLLFRSKEGGARDELVGVVVI